MKKVNILLMKPFSGTMSNVKSGFSVSYSSYKAKQSKGKEMLLKAQLTELKHKISETPTPDIIDSYCDAKSALEALYIDKARGSMIRYQVQYINENENGTRYFLNVEKQNYNKRCIKMLITENENVSDEKKILIEQKKFCENLYTDYNPSITHDELLEIEKKFSKFN